MSKMASLFDEKAASSFSLFNFFSPNADTAKEGQETSTKEETPDKEETLHKEETPDKDEDSESEANETEESEESDETPEDDEAPAGMDVEPRSETPTTASLPAEPRSSSKYDRNSED